MVGASASVVRAAIMGIIMLTALQVGRLPHSGIAILLSAALMCAVNPLILRWDVGFQLSFLAVAGIVYIEPLLKPFMVRLLRFTPLASLVAATLAAQIAVLPLLLFQFGTLAVYTLPVNVLVLPLVPITMALGFASGSVGLLWSFVGALIGQAAWLVASLQLIIIQWFSELPYAALEVSISGLTMTSLYCALVAGLISLYRGRVNLTTQTS
jgi:competence protein ComEC